ncbi:DUF881 domain-containing protein [Nocardioides sp. CBS4Y-1]|uniref:DUF881 domain-containing protein n=1 Tax=Nocardioides acrostichi TaxID=2784339 RepID=A0A930UZW5_9ACTN|nr:DUF881 domain-containing protein [Nocardioides acrostichi]
MVVLVCGSLFVVSNVNSEGTDLRPGRYTDLASLVQAESDQYEGLRRQVQDLSDQVTQLTSKVGDRQTLRAQQRVTQLKDPAGLEPVRGAGVTVTLSDSPLTDDDTEQPSKYLVVHQQDVQAVVNAMWRGGAQAVTVQGQRIVSTTGIQCQGNSITLQGVPYPQPFVISAVGDPTTLEGSLLDDDYVAFYRSQSQQEDVQIGWDMQADADLTAPAYAGLLDLSYAKPLA